MIVQQHSQPPSFGSTQESGLFPFLGQVSLARRTPRNLFKRLLQPNEQKRLMALFVSPQKPTHEDKRLSRLGLAEEKLGKTVATKTAWRCFFKSRYEIRAGEGLHGTSHIAWVEAHNMNEAVRSVRDNWLCMYSARVRALVIETGNDKHRLFSLPTKRTWPEFDCPPLVIEIIKRDEAWDQPLSSCPISTPNHFPQ